MRTLLLLLTLCLAGCNVAPSTHTAIALPSITLAPGAGIQIPLSPAGTPEAHPTMILKVRLIDAATGQSLVGNVYWIPGEVQRDPRDGDIHGRAVSGIDLELGSTADGWLVATVPDYVEWSIRVRYSIKTSRYLDVPAKLVRVVGQGA